MKKLFNKKNLPLLIIAILLIWMVTKEDKKPYQKKDPYNEVDKDTICEGGLTRYEVSSASAGVPWTRYFCLNQAQLEEATKDPNILIR